jgi:hypothetical protein
MPAPPEALVDASARGPNPRRLLPLEKLSSGYRGGAMGYRRALCFLCLQYGISDYHHQAVKHFSFPPSGAWSGKETAGSAYFECYRTRIIITHQHVRSCVSWREPV